MCVCVYFVLLPAHYRDVECVPVKYGELSEVQKRLRSHKIGPASNFARLRRFVALTEVQKRKILKIFNSTSIVIKILMCRNHKCCSCATAQYHDAAYSYRVRVHNDSCTDDYRVCTKAFMSLHGTERGQSENLQKHESNLKSSKAQT